MSTNQERVHALFTFARFLAVEDRKAYLDKECVDDAELREEVESLLKYAPTSAPTRETGTIALGEKDVVDHRYEAGNRIGEYEIKSELGEGGFGIVYFAKQHEPVEREVAIKVLHSNRCTDTFILGFEAERQTLANMSHPGIAHFYDAGLTEHNQPFFVMEFVSGQPITEYCDEHRLSIKQRLALFADVCKAVQHAHNKGVIHRDLTPNNILVSTSEDGSPRAQIIDFGIARKTDEETADVMGTLMYMSPEQATKDASVDTRSDIYTLGVVLYELLVGKPPLDREMFKDAALQAQLKLVKEQDSPTPSTKLSGIGDSDETAAIAEQRQENLVSLLKMLRRELDWIPRKALQKDPERRYATASEFGEDISRYLNDEVVVAVPDSTGYRFKKSLKRHKGVFSGATAIALILIISVFYVSLQWRETEKQRVIAANANVETEAQKYVKNVIGAAPLDIFHIKEKLLESAWVAAGSPPKEEMPFEWRYLNQKYVPIQKWEGEDITGVTVSDTKDRFAIASRKAIRIIDRASGEEVSVIENIRNNKYMLSPDFSRVVLLGGKNKLRIWNVEKKEVEHEILLENGKDASSSIDNSRSRIEFCNERIVAVLHDDKVFVIDLIEGKIRNVHISKFGKCKDIEFAKHKDTLAVASFYGIELFNVSTFELLVEIAGTKSITKDESNQLFKEPKVFGGRIMYPQTISNRLLQLNPAFNIQKIVFSNDDSILIGVESHHYINEWDVKTGEWLNGEDIAIESTPRTSGPPKSGTIWSPKFSSDSSLLAFNFFDEDSIRVWDVKNKVHLSDMPGTKGLFAARGSFSLSEDGTKLCIESIPNKTTCSVYEVHTGKLLETYLHSEDLASHAFINEDGSSLLTSDTYTVILRHEDISELQWPSEENGAYARGNVSVSQEIGVLAVGYTRTERDSSGFPSKTASFVQLYDLESRDSIGSLDVSSKSIEMVTTFSPDGSLLLVCSQQGEYWVYETKTGQRQELTDTFLNASLSPPVFSTNGNRLFVAESSEIKVLDTNSWDVLEIPFVCTGSNLIKSLLLSPSGDRLVVGGMSLEDNGMVYRLHVFDSENGTEIAILHAPSISSSWSSKGGLTPLFSLDGKRLIASGDRIIRQWNTDTWEQVSSLKTDAHVDLLAVDSEYKISGITKVANSSGIMVSAYWSEIAGHELLSLEVNGLHHLTFVKNNEMLLGTARGAVHIFDTDSQDTIQRKRDDALKRYARFEPLVEEWFEEAKWDGEIVSHKFEADRSQWEEAEQATIRNIILKNSIKSLNEQRSGDTPISVLVERLDLRTESIGANDFRTQKLAIEIGKQMYREGDYKGAEEVFREWLEISKNALGESSATTLALGKWLGRSLDAQKKYDEVEVVFTELLEISKNALGEDDPTTISSANWMAHSLFMQENYVEAEEVNRKWLEISKNALGETHHTKLSLAKYYGRSLYEQKKYVEAEAVFQEWSNISRKAEFNFEINITLDLAKGHGQSLYKQEKYDEAEAVYGKWLEICRGIGFAKRSGPMPMPMVNPWWEDKERINQAKDKAISFSFLLGDSMCQQEKYIEAEEVFREWLEISKNALGESSATTLALGKWLGRSLDKQKKYTAAEAVFSEWLEISMNTLGEDHATTIDFASWMAYSLSMQENYVEAEEVYRKWLEISKNTLGESSPTTLALGQWLGKSLDKQKKYTAAEAVFSEWLEISMNTLGEDHATTIDFANWLAYSLLMQENYVGAEEVYRKWLEISLNALGEKHSTTLSLKKYLDQTLEKQKNTE